MSKEAIDRITNALRDAEQTAIDHGLDPLCGRRNHAQCVGEDEDGKPINGMRTPLAAVKAGDVVDVCALVKEPDQVVRDLRKGARSVEPTREVLQQCQCLHRLLELAGHAVPLLVKEKPPDVATA